MYLLYADESGSTKDANQIYFVLASISVFERQCFWLANEMDKIAARFNPADPSSIELHANPMLNGRGYWRGVPKVDREQALTDVLNVVKTSHNSICLFASVIKKSSVSPKDPVEAAFEQLASRFDYFLKRLHSRGQSEREESLFLINQRMSRPCKP